MRLKHYRPDVNEREIVQALREDGVTVQILSSVGNGCSDLLCRKGRKVRLLEVKTPKGKLTFAERVFHAMWAPFAVVVRSKDEARAVFKSTREALR